MNYYVTCNICKTTNPLFQVKCTNCGSFLRERIFNIDLWNIISLLIESPVNAFHKIIKSEHKNFLILILFLISIKYTIDSNFILVFLLKGQMHADKVFLNYGIILLLSLATLLLLTLLLRYTFLRKIKTRTKDIFSLISYSQIPSFLAVILLFPIELIIFGEYVFSTNPSPFLLKTAVAYFLLIFEIGVILWSILLTIFSMYSITGNKQRSVLSGIVVNAALFSVIFLSSIISKYING